MLMWQKDQINNNQKLKINIIFIGIVIFFADYQSRGTNWITTDVRIFVNPLDVCITSYTKNKAVLIRIKNSFFYDFNNFML